MDLKSIHTTERSQHPGFLTSRLKRVRSEDPSGVHPLTCSLLSLVLPMEDFLSTRQQPTQQGLVPSPLELAPSPCPSVMSERLIMTMHTLKWENLEAPVFAGTANTGV